MTLDIAPTIHKDFRKLYKDAIKQGWKVIAQHSSHVVLMHEHNDHKMNFPLGTNRPHERDVKLLRARYEQTKKTLKALDEAQALDNAHIICDEVEADTTITIISPDAESTKQLITSDALTANNGTLQFAAIEGEPHLTLISEEPRIRALQDDRLNRPESLDTAIDAAEDTVREIVEIATSHISKSTIPKEFAENLSRKQRRANARNNRKVAPKTVRLLADKGARELYASELAQQAIEGNRVVEALATTPSKFILAQKPAESSEETPVSITTVKSKHTTRATRNSRVKTASPVKNTSSDDTAKLDLIREILGDDDDLKSRLDTAEKDLAQKRMQLSQSQNRSMKLEDQVTNMKQLNDKLIEENEVMKSEKERVEKELANAKSALASIIQAQTALNSALAQAQTS